MIQSVNDAPKTISQAVVCGEDSSVSITLSATDHDQDSLTYTVLTQPEHGTLNGDPPELTYTPDANFNGEDSFTFKANDGTVDSDAGLITFFINADNDAPVADAQTVETDEDMAVDIILTGTDFDNDSLTFSILQTPQYGSLATEHGTSNITYTPDENYHGEDQFTFRANDGQLDSDPATVSITVLSINDAPVADPKSLSVNEDNTLNITLSGSDVDEDSLTFSVTLTPRHGSLSTEHGTLNLELPNLIYIPDTNYAGIDSFAYTAHDGQLGSDPAIVIITVQQINDAPMADSQALEAYEDTPIAITLTGSDPENDPLVYIISDSTKHGTLVGTAPNLLYTPEPDYDGFDSLIFVVSDSALTSQPAAVRITVHSVNDAPVVDAGENVESWFGVPILLSAQPRMTVCPAGLCPYPGQPSAARVLFHLMIPPKWKPLPNSASPAPIC